MSTDQLRNSDGRFANGFAQTIDIAVRSGVDAHDRTVLDALTLDTDAPMALVEGGIAAVADTANQTHWPCLVRPEVVDCALGERVGG